MEAARRARGIGNITPMASTFITSFRRYMKGNGDNALVKRSARFSETQSHTTSLELVDAAMTSACVDEPEVQSCLRLVACTDAPAS